MRKNKTNEFSLIRMIQIHVNVQAIQRKCELSVNPISIVFFVNIYKYLKELLS